MTDATTQPDLCRVAPAKRLRGLSPYEPPPPSPFTDLILDANEGAAPSDSVMTMLSRIDSTQLCRYPNTAELACAIAETVGVDAARVVVTNGADDAIDRACRATLEPGRSLLIHTPTFEMIERSARLAGGLVRSINWIGGQFPVREYVNAISETTALVTLVSPNNPTGGVIPLADMLEVAKAARAAGALVMIDLAYVEFADEDPTRPLLDEDNVLVIRTFSKASGLAGARVGYAIGPPVVMGWLRTVGGPYPVSSVSLALAAATLRADDERQSYITTVRLERTMLTGTLRELGCEVLESQANFVTVAFADSAFAQRALASLGIAARAFATRPELSEYVRITLPGNVAAARRVQMTLRTILDPRAILFDLDGVLADVSRSYREAIIRTARAFGVVLTAADINAAKRTGQANNDWELTKRLIEERGVACALTDIIPRFQRAYTGSTDAPGLRETERLIADPAMLRRLSEQFALGIVTGRPRDEAEWFLDRAGVRDLFSTLVSMEDAPAKPSPAPVLHAMRTLGAESAWMIGDTPDDMTAARRAGVLPIGVTTPGDDPTMSSDVLFRSGAAAVIDDVSRIEEMIG